LTREAGLKGTRIAAEVSRHHANAFAELHGPLVRQLRHQGLSIKAIARELQARGIKPRIGGPFWSTASVRNLLARWERLRGDRGAEGLTQNGRE
jgi:hypothetical protein